MTEQNRNIIVQRTLYHTLCDNPLIKMHKQYIFNINFQCFKGNVTLNLYVVSNHYYKQIQDINN
jgi:hypothetical protein